MIGKSPAAPSTDASDDTEDEEENREYIEEANADTVMFALTKLVATDTVAKEHLAPETISHLEKYGASVGEIVKHLLTGLEKKGDVSNILVEALKRAYQRYLAATSSGNDEESSKKFQECKDLAARLSGSYVGVARNKYKSEILNVVREGINYAFSDAPKQLSFLEGAVLYFVSKLPASDILDMGFQLAKHRAKLEQRHLSGDSWDVSCFCAISVQFVLPLV